MTLKQGICQDLRQGAASNAALCLAGSHLYSRPETDRNKAKSLPPGYPAGRPLGAAVLLLLLFFLLVLGQ